MKQDMDWINWIGIFVSVYLLINSTKMNFCVYGTLMPVFELICIGYFDTSKAVMVGGWPSG